MLGASGLWLKKRIFVRTLRLGVMRSILGILLFGILPSVTWAQDHVWWSQNVGWDGVTHWREYLVFSPRYLGPNALPVPEQSLGRVFRHSEVHLAGNVHWSPGDRTINPAGYLRYAAWPGRISFDLYWVPVEFFRTSHHWKTERNVFHTFYDTRQAGGDVILQTQFQVFSELPKRPGLALRVGYRFPSSNTVGAARFTDSPGFHIDFSAGKDWTIGQDTLRPVAMLGLLVWQTNQDDQVQNDALLYGAGLEYRVGKWMLRGICRGYAGYLDNGDRPVQIEFLVRKDWSWGALWSRYIGGFGDWPYQRWEFGVGRRLHPNRTRQDERRNTPHLP